MNLYSIGLILTLIGSCRLVQSVDLATMALAYSGDNYIAGQALADALASIAGQSSLSGIGAWANSDADECAADSTNDCATKAYCSNTFGDFSCVCKTGYTDTTHVHGRSGLFCRTTCTNGWAVNDDKTCIHWAWLILWWVLILLLLLPCLCILCFLCCWCCCCRNRRSKKTEKDPERNESRTNSRQEERRHYIVPKEYKTKETQTTKKGGVVNTIYDPYCDRESSEFIKHQRKMKKQHPDGRTCTYRSIQQQTGVECPDPNKKPAPLRRRTIIQQTNTQKGTERSWAGFCREDYDPYVDKDTRQWQESQDFKKRRKEEGTGVIYVKTKIQQTGDPEKGWEDGYCRHVTNPTEPDDKYYRARPMPKSNLKREYSSLGMRTPNSPRRNVTFTSHVARRKSRESDDEDEGWMYSDEYGI